MERIGEQQRRCKVYSSPWRRGDNFNESGRERGSLTDRSRKDERSRKKSSRLRAYKYRRRANVHARSHNLSFFENVYFEGATALPLRVRFTLAYLGGKFWR